MGKAFLDLRSRLKGNPIPRKKKLSGSVIPHDIKIEGGYGDQTAYIQNILELPDGKILISGNFYLVDGNFVPGIARLNSDWSYDDTFSANLSPQSKIYGNTRSSVESFVAYKNTIKSVSLQPDGKILVAGDFQAEDGGYLQRRIARLNEEGSIDTTFSPKVFFLNNDVSGDYYESWEYDKIPQRNIDIRYVSSNNIIVTTSASYGWEQDPLIKEFDTPTQFIGNAAYSITSLNGVIPSGDDTIVYGKIAKVDGEDIGGIFRLTQNNELDTSFSAGMFYTNSNVTISSTIHSAYLLPNNKIMIYGDSLSNAHAGLNDIARLNSDGSIDNTFTSVSPTSVSPRFVLFNDDGTTREVSTSISNSNVTIRTIDDSGSVTSTVLTSIISQNTSNTFTSIKSSQVYSDGKILVGGDFVAAGGETHQNALLLDSSLNRDSSLVMNTNGEILCSTIDSSGRLLIGGNFTSVNGTTRNRMARLNSDGTLDTTFNPNVNGRVYGISIQSNGKILLSGEFTRVRNTVKVGSARINEDSTLDTTFTNGNFTSTTFGKNGRFSFELPDGQILYGDSASSGGTRVGLALLSSTGSLVTSFDMQLDAGVYNIEPDSDGGYIVCGWFTSFGGQPFQGLARLNSDLTLDTDFYIRDSLYSSSVLSVKETSDGRFVLAGFIRKTFTQDYAYVVMGSDGYIDWDYQRIPGTANKVLIDSSKILLAGSFSSDYYKGMLVIDDTTKSRDTSFNIYYSTRVNDIIKRSDGKFWTLGLFSASGSLTTAKLSRLLPDGSVDPAFVIDIPSVIGTVSTPNVAHIARLPNDNFIVSFRGTGEYFIKIDSDDNVSRIYPEASDRSGGWSGIVISSQFGDLAFCQGLSSTSRLYGSYPTLNYNGIVYSGIVDLDSNFMIKNKYFNPDFLSPDLYGGDDGAIYNSTTGFPFANGKFYASLLGYGGSTIPDSGTGYYIGYPASLGVFDTSIWAKAGGVISLSNNGDINDFGVAESSLFDATYSHNSEFRKKTLPIINEFGGIDGYYTVNINTMTRQEILDMQASEIESQNDAFRSRMLVERRRIFGDYDIYNENQFSPPYTEFNYLSALCSETDNQSRLLLGLTTINYGEATSKNRYRYETPEYYYTQTSIDSFSINRIIRINTDMTEDNTFTASVKGSIMAIKVLPDNRIAIGGNFHEVNGQEKRYLAILNDDGTTDESFNPELDWFVNRIEYGKRGTLIISGSFTKVDGSSTQNVAEVWI